MENEKLLPPGESAPTTPPSSHFHLENKITATPPAQPPRSAAPVMPVTSRPLVPQPIVHPMPDVAEKSRPPFTVPTGTLSGTPSPQAQQWGVVISIVVIVSMIIVGAFYAWGKRIAEQNALTSQAITQ